MRRRQEKNQKQKIKREIEIKDLEDGSKRISVIYKGKFKEKKIEFDVREQYISFGLYRYYYDAGEISDFIQAYNKEEQDVIQRIREADRVIGQNVREFKKWLKAKFGLKL